MGKQIKISTGILEGVETEDAYVFKGVPYAKPPVGQLRFHDPVEPEPWEGVRKADTFGPKCPQDGTEPGDKQYAKEFYSAPEFAVPQSEDCLYLNVWMPKEPGTYPVAVWFHGGGYMNGYGSESEFDGDAYARRGVILVTVNYRLGILGYFTHPELDEKYGNSGNYGMLDQIASVDWVRREIGAFGGDPEQITIFGQSAGGMSVLTLISSPLMKGKIKGAIIQSAGGYKSPLKTGIPKDKMQKAYVKFLKKKKMSLQQLMELPAEEVNKLAFAFIPVAIPYTHAILSFGTVGGGTGQPLSCDEVLQEGKELPISYMLGCTKDDIGVKKAAARDRNKNKLYISNREFCKLREEQGMPAYTYYFSRELPGDTWGAFHSAELWYMFGTLKRCWRPLTQEDQVLSDEMLDAWTSFMKCGDPGWDACTKETGYYTKEFNIRS